MLSLRVWLPIKDKFQLWFWGSCVCHCEDIGGWAILQWLVAFGDIFCYEWKSLVFCFVFMSEIALCVVDLWNDEFCSQIRCFQWLSVFCFSKSFQFDCDPTHPGDLTLISCSIFYFASNCNSSSSSLAFSLWNLFSLAEGADELAERVWKIAILRMGL
jgi:hypothetical protein